MIRQVRALKISCLIASIASFPVLSSASENAISKRAIEALSKELAIEKKDIQVIKQASVQWSDTSLGCPRVGLMYPQVITPGHKVILKSGGKTHAVHLSDVRAIVCKNPATSRPEKGKAMKLGELRIDKLTRQAKHDLATKTGVSEKDIYLRSAKSVNWPDTSLGCGKKEQTSQQKKIRGYRLVFRVNGIDYSYHTDEDQRVIACPEIASM